MLTLVTTPKVLSQFFRKDSAVCNRVNVFSLGFNERFSSFSFLEKLSTDNGDFCSELFARMADKKKIALWKR